MKAKTILGLLLLISVSAARADEFSLVDQQGRKHGPVVLEEGATVTTAREQLSVVDIKRRDEGLKTRLMEIMVPDLTFDKTSLADAVQMFQDASRKYDTSRRADREKGVTFVLVLDYDGEKVGGGPDAKGSWRALVPCAEDRNKVTGTTRNGPLWSTLEAVLSQFGAKPLARDGIVLVVDRNAAESPIVVKKYHVKPTVCERVAERQCEDPGRPPRNDDTPLKTFCESMGVPWPNGSSIKYVPAIGQMVVANTAENLMGLENLLVDIDVQPSQIEIEVQYVAFKKSDIAVLAARGIVDAGDLVELRKQGKAELMACPKVVTKSGSEAVIKSVEEYIYPTEFTAGTIASTNTNDVAVLFGAVVEPSGFEMREVGTILEVAPDVSPEGMMIDLTFTPQLVQEPEWRDYGCEVVDKDGKKHKLAMQQPFFFSHTVSTSVSVYDGETVFLGGGAPSRDREKIVYIFATARLVGADGKPLRKRERTVSD